MTPAAEAAALAPLEHAAGVAAFSGPFPVTWTSLHKGHTTGGAEVEGRSSAVSSVDQPKQLHGSWVQPGGVVVEAGFASGLGIHVGDQLTLGDATFDVVGTAATAAIPSYPDVCAEAEGCFIVGSVSSSNPGLIWATEADAARIAGTDGPIAYFLNLKLDDALAATAFADRYNANTSPSAPYLLSWQRIRNGDAQVLAKVQLVLSTGSWLLALLAIASVAVLVGGRMSEQTRRVGLLKAVGRHAANRRRRAASRARPDRRVCSCSRADRRMARGAADRRTWGRPHRRAERAIADRIDGWLGGRIGSGRRDPGDFRSGDPRRASKHRRSAERFCAPAAASCMGDRSVGESFPRRCCSASGSPPAVRVDLC